MVRHWRTWTLVIAVGWIAVVTFWALQPMTIDVRVGTNPDGSDRSSVVECDSPLSGNTDPTSALPPLAAGEAFGDAPCDGPVTSARTLYVLDVVVAAGIVLLVLLVRRRSDDPEGDDTAPDRSTPVAA